MILQRIQFPRTDICSREKMFFRVSEGAILKGSDNSIVYQRGSISDTNTYFNSFSISKWVKYTQIKDVNITIDFKGSFWVVLYSLFIDNNRVIYKNVKELQIDSEERASKTISFDTMPDRGVLHFKLISLSDSSVYYGGYYSTDDSFPVNDVSLAIGICTFRREDDVHRNIRLFNKDLVENPNSALRDKIQIFISDNGRTLGNDLESEHVHIFPNKNAGGAGGFTRTMIEALKSRQEFTHMLLMDDDVLINPESVSRTIAFLQCLKPEYQHAFIGGHMLNKERQYQQSEAADCWDRVRHHPVKPRFALENDRDIIENEIEEKVNYLSWWYCCMPMNVISNDNLPLPLFIKRDDIEYGLRNGSIFITLNGICVWHEPFDKKAVAHLQYYYFRNLLIIDSVHRKLTKEHVKQELQRVVIEQHLYRYRYRDAEFALLGVQHYLKGIDFFKSLEPEGLNEALYKHNYSWQPVENFNVSFSYRSYADSFSYNESPLKRKLREMTFNGILLSANQDVTVPSYAPNPGLIFRADKVLNYEDSSRTAFMTQKDKACIRAILKMYHETLRMLDSRYDEVTEEYRERFSELTNIDFWTDYLSREKESYDFEKRYDDRVRPSNTKEQRDELLESRLLRTIQRVVPTPLKGNRIMLHAENRKGFTCNPKYVLQKLIETMDDACEIIWVSPDPKSCELGNTYGVRVVKEDSKEHKELYLGTKVYITNDSFPEWAEHKPGQIWINLWHGALSYKHIGLEYLVTRSRYSEELFNIANRQPDYYISACHAFTADTAASFGFDEAIFREYGLPRNDIFFGEHEDLKKAVRAKLGIDEGKKVALYAPTFRLGWKSSTYGLDFAKLKKSLAQRFGGEWEVLFRNHSFVTGPSRFSATIDVTSYEDMNELMLVADVLLSDYSSCMYDFSLQRKPCFVYAPDADTFINSDRGLAIPMDEWPYPIARSNDELAKAITSFDETSYKQRLEEHFDSVGAADDGHASERVVELIRSAMQQ